MAARTPRSERFLIADSGHTTVHFGICTATRLLCRFRVPSRPTGALAAAKGELAAGIAAHGPLAGALVSSVVPRLNGTLARICRDAGVAAVFLTHETPSGIRLAYPRPWEIGADRIANAVAARELHGAPAIVVDVGTALTFDCISARGEYLGGIIAPGPRLSCAALAGHTGLLPLVEPAAPPGVIGRSTVQAIRSGVVLGTRLLIRGLVKELRRPLGGRPALIFTGGQFGLVARGWAHHGLVEPFLTLHGLRIIRARLPRGDGPG